ncbi:AbrB/MazE/SpoVT family DNA-binding domain-containing protein [archaeon]|nr:AbrB/MazE/SpoVT family DNA-binding domain-containing protein [archaeon]
MSDISVTRMSSKGQIVIPREMRTGFTEGEKFVVIRSGNRLILKSVNDFDENIAEDLRFAERTEEALKRYERGKFKEMSKEEFLEELETW